MENSNPSHDRRVDLNSAEARAAESWYGYGNWSASYWFIGPEPGMAKDEGENLRERCEAWVKLGCPELLDNRDHHRAFGLNKWHARTSRMVIPVDGHSMRPPTQSTWRRLITVLLAFKGERSDNDAIGHYQAAEWGSANGETVVAELSALAANSLAVGRDRDAFRHERCVHIRERMLENKPKFVLMYGLGASPWFVQIAGSSFHSGFAWSGDTLCALVEHPTARPGKSAEWWIAKGQEMREMIEGRESSS